MIDKQSTLLIVDDDKNNLISLEKVFDRESIQVIAAEDGKKAFEIIRSQRINAVLTDLRMPGMGGDDLLKAIKTISPDTEIVLMTAYGTIEAAVEAMKHGAYDFVEKPLKRAQIVKTVKRAIERCSLVMENRTLKNRLKKLEKRTLIGNSQAFRQMYETSMQAADSMASILILGESGTGKELLARAIHENSTKPDGPFVPVNCAALPETIMEAELFGYEKGSFTGAVTKRLGRFAKADGGTIFLDEVAEINPATQIKLLRVLQEGEFEPLGGETTFTDVRIVAATNKDLEEEVKEKNFREDLFYRLNVIVIKIPPLRQRLDDVPLLAEHFLSRYVERNSKDILGISPRAMDALTNYYWPGNVRELENVMERAVVMTRKNIIEVSELPQAVINAKDFSGQVTFQVGASLAGMELTMIKQTLRHTKGDKKLAGRLLGIAPRTIYRKLEQSPVD